MENSYQRPLRLLGQGLYPPTLEEASVRLLSVELFPADGLPTRPISGSRGMMTRWDRLGEGVN